MLPTFSSTDANRSSYQKVAFLNSFAANMFYEEVAQNVREVSGQ
jgi:hypothetical protein